MKVHKKYTSKVLIVKSQSPKSITNLMPFLIKDHRDR